MFPTSATGPLNSQAAVYDAGRHGFQGRSCVPHRPGLLRSGSCFHALRARLRRVSKLKGNDARKRFAATVKRLFCILSANRRWPASRAGAQIRGSVCAHSNVLANEACPSAATGTGRQHSRICRRPRNSTALPRIKSAGGGYRLWPPWPGPSAGDHLGVWSPRSAPNRRPPGSRVIPDRPIRPIPVDLSRYRNAGSGTLAYRRHPWIAALGLREGLRSIKPLEETLSR